MKGAESANIFSLTTQAASNGAGNASNLFLITQENGKSYKITQEALNGAESANIFSLTTQEASNGVEKASNFCLITKEHGKSFKITQEALKGAESANIFSLATQKRRSMLPARVFLYSRRLGAGPGLPDLVLRSSLRALGDSVTRNY